MRCGYDLRGLPEPVCPECRATIDPAWYRAPLAAGSGIRKALVVVAVMNAGLIALALLGGVLVLAVVPARIGAWEAAPRGLIATLSLGLGLAVGIGVFAWKRQRLLVWGPRRGVILVHAGLLAVFLLLVIAGELQTRPTG
ncbi:MAG: hypothetical protein ACIARR_10900 [Phycisphaerales bacterium JB059]